MENSTWKKTLSAQAQNSLAYRKIGDILLIQESESINFAEIDFRAIKRERPNQNKNRTLSRVLQRIKQHKIL